MNNDQKNIEPKGSTQQMSKEIKTEVVNKMMAKNKAAAAELLLRMSMQVERVSVVTRTEKM